MTLLPDKNTLPLPANKNPMNIAIDAHEITCSVYLRLLWAIATSPWNLPAHSGERTAVDRSRSERFLPGCSANTGKGWFSALHGCPRWKTRIRSVASADSMTQ